MVALTLNTNLSSLNAQRHLDSVQEELGNAKLAEEPAENANTPHGILSKVMKEKGLSFESVKKKLIKEGYEDAESLSSIVDISKTKIFELIERINKI